MPKLRDMHDHDTYFLTFDRALPTVGWSLLSRLSSEHLISTSTVLTDLLLAGPLSLLDH